MMHLSNILETDNQLISCKICRETISLQRAIKIGWKKDIDEQVIVCATDCLNYVPLSNFSKHSYYCPDCISFLVNDQDICE